VRGLGFGLKASSSINSLRPNLLVQNCNNRDEKWNV